MLETGTSGLMSGDEKRDDALPSAPALVLDSTIVFRASAGPSGAKALVFLGGYRHG